MIVVIDNYDSFVHNLARYLRRCGAETLIVRNDATTPEAVLGLSPKAIVVSPGPKTPAQAGISLAIIRALPPDMPFLGVCLGHQCLVEAFEGETRRAREPLHGAASDVFHDDEGLFSGIENPCTVGRYHSLISRVPEGAPLIPCAHSNLGEVMAVRHQSRPWFGVQFHPESVLTKHGAKMIENFMRRVG